MKIATSKVTVVSGSAAYQASFLNFARVEYGKNSYQALASFYKWQYELNPNCPNGLTAMLLAVDESSNVVGFVNRTFMEWTVKGERMIIPTIVDLSVESSHRNGGIGLRLILKATSECAHAFTNGSNANSAPLFRSMKYQQLEGARWFRKILSPIRGALRFGRHKLTGGLPKPHRMFAPRHITVDDRFRTYSEPNAETLNKLTEFLNGTEKEIQPHWTMESVRWRFFDPLGPRHLLLIEDDVNGSVKNAMLVSAGPTRGLNVCRLVAHRTQNALDFKNMLACALRLARNSGVDAFVAFSFDATEAEAIASVGFSELKQAPNTFFYHKRKKDAEVFQNVLVQGSVSDFGFEAVARCEMNA